jgi:hypothetical protein
MVDLLAKSGWLDKEQRTVLPAPGLIFDADT